MAWQDPKRLATVGFTILVVNAVALYMRWLMPLDREIPERIWVPVALTLVATGLILLGAAATLAWRAPRTGPRPASVPMHRRPEVYALLAFVAFPAGAMASARLSTVGQASGAIWWLALLAGFLLLGCAAWFGRRSVSPERFAGVPVWALLSGFTLDVGLSLLLFNWVESHEGLEGPTTFGLLSLVSGGLAAAAGGWLVRARASGYALLAFLGMLGAWSSLLLIWTAAGLAGAGGA